MSLSPGSSLPFSAVTYARKSITCTLLSYQGQHESVSRYRGVWAVLPTDIFRIAFITGDFLAGAPGTCANRYLRLCLASGVVQHRALLLLVLFDIATVRLRLK